ncbi:MAG TPA: DNA-3-methyladenine glycosylase [Methylotenera sp.]|nr:DNA-3-methyladenine glycosylase [Methylotenera sp.]
MLVDSEHLQHASQFLSQLDKDWAHLIATVGPCTFEAKPEREPYEALIHAVAYQQLHAKAGDAIIKRLLNLYGDIFPTPASLLTTEFDALRACGFSARKIETIQGIAEGALSGLVPTRDDADVMTDEELIERLVALKGIGRWTVEMLLIFTLKRMDILPADDFGVVEGYRRLKKLESAPKRKQIAEIALAWSPYRTIASWYLWRMPK